MTDQHHYAAAASRPQGDGLPGQSRPAADRGGAVVLAEAVDARMLMIMRCVLAVSAFAIVCVDASEPRRWVELARVSLSASSNRSICP